MNAKVRDREWVRGGEREGGPWPWPWPLTIASWLAWLPAGVAATSYSASQIGGCMCMGECVGEWVPLSHPQNQQLWFLFTQPSKPKNILFIHRTLKTKKCTKKSAIVIHRTLETKKCNCYSLVIHLLFTGGVPRYPARCREIAPGCAEGERICTLGIYPAFSHPHITNKIATNLCYPPPCLLITHLFTH